MLNSQMIDHLNRLIQIDIDAYHAYTQAINGVKDLQIKEQLTAFRRDHEIHVENLAKHVQAMGGTPPQFSRDFTGFLISGYTAIRGMISEVGALKAMLSNEKIPFDSYHEVLAQEGWPEEIAALLKTHAEDEEKHLQYIDNVVRSMAAA